MVLTKLGTYLVLKRIWNPVDFQGQRSPGQILRRGDKQRFALPLFVFIPDMKVYSQEGFLYIMDFTHN
jgi:hypothetical protein